MSSADLLARAARRNGGPVRLGDETWLAITDVDRLPPFLMSIPSDTDLWMFLSSTGALTAGRKDPDGAIFPYVTEDLLHDSRATTGPVTLVRVRRGRRPEVLWEPFAGTAGAEVQRNLYKHPMGTPVRFEEVHRGLGLVFRYDWCACDAFGFVRTVTLENLGDEAEVTVLDGLRNLLPFGAPLALHQHSSSLVDAYKRSEVDAPSRLGIFSLTSRITDRAEATEELHACVVAPIGLPGARCALSAEAVDRFRAGEEIAAEFRLNGRRGNYLMMDSTVVSRSRPLTWRQILDTGRDHSRVVALRESLGDPATLETAVDAALSESRRNLRGYLASADGFQRTADDAATSHHTANVLYNAMRGGAFASQHRAGREDFRAFVKRWNGAVFHRHETWIDALPEALDAADLRARAAGTGDADLERIATEYLPLHFARRHGDPSRPWNRFEIRVRQADGSRSLRYEGNWRDIFQNWDALSLSYPEFLPGFVARFLNATTVDGFNPYRVSSDGMDWEIEEPGHPWSNFGYWGDHQIAYLLRFLETWSDVDPGGLEAWLDRPIFAYAEVPYRIVPFDEMVEHPRTTLRFDAERDARIRERVRELGADGRLWRGADGGVLHVTLFEKLLVPVLSKLSNLVPGAGIWMNTQRPEWNDANNALVGHGVSVVTLAYLRRMLVFLESRFEPRARDRFPVSAEVARWTRELGKVFEDRDPAVAEDDASRMRMLAALGRVFSRYRDAIERGGPSRLESLEVSEALALFRRARAHVERGLAGNLREDGLCHAYNLLAFSAARDAVRVERLPLMLEGQVAALSAGHLPAADAAALLDALFASDLYRTDVGSFMLYPEKRIPGFLEINSVNESKASSIPLLASMLAGTDQSIVTRDAQGTIRFAAAVTGTPALVEALERLARDPRTRDAVERDREAVMALFEDTFHHRAYTGRSGTMYGYEGLGSIYWHMVAKLLVAVQETCARATIEGAPAAVRESLARHYFRIRAGLGFEKSAESYGAFPSDPYSHTPAGGGARQPGMTGQAKEQILARFGELGVAWRDGCLVFHPTLLRTAEFLEQDAEFEGVGVDGSPFSLPLRAGSLAFTLAQVPIVYRRGGDAPAIGVIRRDGGRATIAGDRLDRETTHRLLSRTGEIVRVEVDLPDERLRRD